MENCDVVLVMTEDYQELSVQELLGACGKGYDPAKEDEVTPNLRPEWWVRDDVANKRGKDSFM